MCIPKTMYAIAAMISGSYIFVDTDASSAADARVNGAPLVILDGVYQYNSGGVPLFGYIVERKNNNEDVNFLVCATGHTIVVKQKDLAHVDSECSKPSGNQKNLWATWSVSSGNLVVTGISGLNAKDAGSMKALLKDVEVNKLPDPYKSVVENRKTQEWAAVSFESEKGEVLFGVIQ